MTDEFLDDLEWLIISLFKILYYGLVVYGSFIVAGWCKNWIIEKDRFDEYYSNIVNFAPKQNPYFEEYETEYTHRDLETTIILNYISGVKISDLDKLYLFRKCGLDWPAQALSVSTKELIEVAKSVFLDIEYCPNRHKAIWKMQKKYGDPIVKMAPGNKEAAGTYNIRENKIRLLPWIIRDDLVMEFSGMPLFEIYIQELSHIKQYQDDPYETTLRQIYSEFTLKPKADDYFHEQYKDSLTSEFHAHQMMAPLLFLEFDSLVGKNCK